ncbi:GerMN domain-containing protein [Spirochaeta cellobiosiphila]|uniref:GerMN domain-containing protein n=1 Tax=Spirochaeta cellobiosiphila TaxID=504483 RepID=UPI000425D6A1|nr:GerMN domain-containing protein [Spirochaeta cellobiosiphila]
MKKRQIPTSVLVWIALVLFVLVVFLLNRKTIEHVLEVTGFVDIVQENWEIKEPELHPTYLDDSTYNPDLSEEEKEIANEATNTVVENQVEDSNQSLPVDSDSREEKEDSQDRTRISTLYFLKVNNDGKILLRSSERQIPYSESPLTSTLHILLAGTTPEEANDGLISLIPHDSKLLGISVADGIAVVNFSEDFQFNQIGIEGYDAQLKQIVYTATEFSTVNKVQFLIEGRKVPYLGAEGLYIMDPLGREVFEQ